MTLEAWVKPSRRGTVRLKERGPRLSYGLYARPSAHVSRAPRRAPSLPLRRWSHLAMTWDGSVVRVYRDGAQVASHALAGAAPASDGPLRIGGNAIWPEFFKGVIDEVRVCDRALSATEIARDRDRGYARNYLPRPLEPARPAVDGAPRGPGRVRCVRSRANCPAASPLPAQPQ